VKQRLLTSTSVAPNPFFARKSVRALVTTRGHVLVRFERKKAARAQIRPRRHAQVRAVDMAMAVRVGIGAPEVLAHGGDMRRPVVHADHAAHRVRAAVELLDEPVVGDRRVGVGERKPARAERERPLGAVRPRQADVARVDVRHVGAERSDDGFGVVGAAVEHDDHAHVLPQKPVMDRGAAGGRDAFPDMRRLVVGGNDDAEHVDSELFDGRRRRPRCGAFSKQCSQRFIPCNGGWNARRQRGPIVPKKLPQRRWRR
jgi:hypothetical protein